jgi:hypothetical protein
MHKSPVLMCCFRLQHSSDHLQPGITQTSDTGSSNTRVWVLHCHHNSAQAGSDDGLRAGRRAALMATGFQGDHQGSTAGLFTSLCESAYLSMGLTSTCMEPLSDKLASLV